MSRQTKNKNNNNGPSKSKGNNRRGDSWKKSNKSSSRDEALQDYGKSNNANDPSWYVPTDQNIADVASFSLNNILGTDYHLDGVYRANVTSGDWPNNIIPGVMSLSLVPTVGVSNDMSSPINLAATDIYNEIRRANSGAKVYDAVDCMQLILALGSIYSAISWAQRLYGLANVYSSANTYFPKALIAANHVDPDSILNHMADYRARLNNIVLQVNTFNVPKGLPIFDRWFRMFSGIYADSTTPRAQLYQYIPYGFYKYNDTSTSLMLSPLMRHSLYTQHQNMTYDQVIDYITEMVNGLIYSEDARTISADIEKAFGAGGLYNLPMIDEAYSVLPDYSDELRTQIMNARSLNLTSMSEAEADVLVCNIAQDPTRSYLVTNYNFNTDLYSCGNMGGWWLNTHSSVLSPMDVMTSTRLIPTFNNEIVVNTTNQGWCKTNVGSCGSEIAVGLEICYYDMVGGKPQLSYNTLGTSIYIGESTLVPGDKPTISEFAKKMFLLQSFDWSPRMNVYTGTSLSPGSSPKLQFVAGITDYDNGVMLEDKELSRLHATALMGEFGIPKLRV